MKTKALAVLALAVALVTGSALGQHKGGKDERRPPPQQMKKEDRQRMREDVREAYRFYHVPTSNTAAGLLCLES